MHESANMRAIAIVSMLFLPGTFICVSYQPRLAYFFSHKLQGVLGTNLFGQEELNSNSGEDLSSPFRASRQWWILLVTILPLTALTFIAWSVWRKKSENDIETKISNENEEVIKKQEFEPFNPRAQRRRSSIATLSSGLTKINSIWSGRSRNGRDLEMGMLPNGV